MIQYRRAEIFYKIHVLVAMQRKMIARTVLNSVGAKAKHVLAKRCPPQKKLKKSQNP